MSKAEIERRIEFLENALAMRRLGLKDKKGEKWAEGYAQALKDAKMALLGEIKI